MITWFIIYAVYMQQIERVAKHDIAPCARVRNQKGRMACLGNPETEESK